MTADQKPKKSLGASSVAALGIVFGDLGTSPLYTYQTVIQDAGNKIDPATLLGSLSLVIWALIIVVTLKYAALVMQADNHGEGGILALLSLVSARVTGSWRSRSAALVAAGLFGAALLYGDGAITPSISVLSALEGINTATPIFKPFILPGAVLVLVALFAAQPFGTAKIGVVFGPVMLLWFLAIGAIGLSNIVLHPAVLRGLDPLLAAEFLVRHRLGSLVVLGGVFLALTGAEALYADMSHVGRAPVRIGWIVVVLPALLLSYAGQAAALAAHPGAQGNPFFSTIPHILVIPMVVLATLATIIASQAIITGTFTLTRQAMQLGWFPGLNIKQTSDTEYGQIYVPVVNWIMMTATLLITIGFGSSSRLSGAYGTAVSTTMLMTTILIYDVMRVRWKWNAGAAALVAAFFLAIDLSFFIANLLKIFAGGFVPLAIGFALFTIMITWHRGIELVREGLKPFGERSDEVLRQIKGRELPRTPGSIVFLSRAETEVPPIMARHAAEFQSLPEKIVVLSVNFLEQPRVSPEERVQVRALDTDVWLVRVRFGFVEIPNLSAALLDAENQGCGIELDRIFYMVGRDEVVPGKESKMLAWRRVLFSFMYRNAVRASDRFDLPHDRLIEIGRQVEI